ncbi:hypothetical protein Pcinc_027279 [Petrolisthes cinctipes]|uniref:Uncharacterized protein n=1 Tax=Petrolisthes cinctipes TaxID=88211 RepID=A0AAE1K703_PETCI|nr:hypothetical protein Pcinc_027279 [Petrolisthes cinctipes]
MCSRVVSWEKSEVVSDVLGWCDEERVVFDEERVECDEERVVFDEERVVSWLKRGELLDPEGCEKAMEEEFRDMMGEGRVKACDVKVKEAQWIIMKVEEAGEEEPQREAEAPFRRGIGHFRVEKKTQPFTFASLTVA